MCAVLYRCSVCISVSFLFPSTLFCQSSYPPFTQLLLLPFLLQSASCMLRISECSPMNSMYVCGCVHVHAIKRFSVQISLESSASVLLPTHGKSRWIYKRHTCTLNITIQLLEYTIPALRPRPSTPSQKIQWRNLSRHGTAF